MKIYFRIVLTVLMSYIGIKMIDNYNYYFDIISLLVSLLTPFIIAFIVAYALNPLITFLEEKFKFKRIVALLSTYLFILAILFSSVLFTLPQIFESLVEIVNEFPVYVEKTQNFIIHLTEELKNIDEEVINDITTSIMNSLPTIGNMLMGSLGTLFNTTFSVGKFLVQLVLSFIICFYMLLEKESFSEFLQKIVTIIFGDKFSKNLSEFFTILNSNIGKYFSGKILDSTIVGIISGIGLFLVGSKYSLLFGTLIGFMNMIPYFGPVIGMTPVVIINLFYDPKVAMFSLLYLILVQQIEVAVIEPKIVGGQLGLSPFLTILAVTIGGGFFGIPGMILSVPIIGVIKIYTEKFIQKNYK
ncbi:MAG: AI-2E family transporter [Peptostreptococcaceae bacterium]